MKIKKMLKPERVWKVIMIIASILLILSSLSPLLFIQ